MSTITRFEHPASRDAPDMFVLRAERDLWAEVLLEEVGDRDMAASAEFTFSLGTHPQYHRHVRLVASDGATPASEEDVLGVASLDFPMADNLRVVDVAVVVRPERRRQGIGTSLHAAALEVAREFGRTTLQAWTWEPASVPAGVPVVPAGTGDGAVAADTGQTGFLLQHGYGLGQVERISRLQLPGDRLRKRDEALADMPSDYEVIALHGRTPGELLADAAALSAAMASDVPTGDMDVGEEIWDAERVRASDDQLEMANRDQLQVLVRHVESGEFVGFTRLIRDRALPEVAHQWETLVLHGHRGHGLGMLMKRVNHAAVAESWPETTRLITGNASENSHMLAINIALGYEPYAANGFWELRRGAVG